MPPPFNQRLNIGVRTVALTIHILRGGAQLCVCTPEQAIAEQRRQMQCRDLSTSSEGQQAYARWLYLQQIQRQRMEQESLGPPR